MATILDLGFLRNFSFIFTFLLVFAIVYGILSYKELLGKNKALQLIISLVVGLLVLLSDTVRIVIETAAPWFVVLFILVVFILLAFNIFGAGTGDFMGVLRNPEYKYISMWIISFAIIIILYSLSQGLGQNAGPYLDEQGEPTSAVDDANWNNTLSASERLSGDGKTNTDDFNKNLGATIFHPKVLGMILILLIASFAVRMLSVSE